MHQCKLKYRLNNNFFEYINNFRTLTNKFRRHMRVKEQLFQEFDTEIDRTLKEMLIVEKVKDQFYVMENSYLLTPQIKKMLFQYIFNEKLMIFLSHKAQSLSKVDENKAVQLLTKPMIQRGKSRVIEFEDFKTIKGYIDNHAMNPVFTKLKSHLLSGKYSNSLSFGHTKTQIAKRDSTKGKSIQNKLAVKQVEQQKERAQFIIRLEEKELKTFLSAFLYPLRDEKMVIEYSKDFTVGLIYNVLELIFMKDRY